MSAVAAPTTATTMSAVGGLVVERAEPRDHVDAGRHHRRRVDQRRHRRRALHRVGQPDVQRDLRALAASRRRTAAGSAIVTGPNTPRASGARPPALSAMSTRSRLPKAWKMRIIPRIRPTSPMRLTMNALLPGGRGAVLLEPEPDQQVGAEPDALPAHEHQRQVAAQHEQQHEEREQVQVREVAHALLVVRHVADRVDVDQRADAGDDQHHHAESGSSSRFRRHAEARDLDPLEAEVGLGEAQPLLAAARRRRAAGRSRRRSRTRRAPCRTRASRRRSAPCPALIQSPKRASTTKPASGSSRTANGSSRSSGW